MSIGTDAYLITKSLHIIFMVSYFAGLFYLLRLLVYHQQAKGSEYEKPLQRQFESMIQKLWNIIILPAGLIMLLTGVLMLSASEFAFLQMPWMHIKLTLLLLFLGFHLFSWKQTQLVVKQHKTDYSSLQFRKINEIPTLFLFAIVFVVIFKQRFLTLYPQLIVGFIVLILVIFVIIRLVNSNKK